jgi:hypothetical protein
VGGEFSWYDRTVVTVVISRFEDIESWRSARELGAEVYGLSTKGAFGKDFGLRNQIQRPTEFIRYLTIAQSSAIEVQSHLYIALDLQYITHPDFERLYKLVESVRKLIGGFIRYLETTKNQKLETRN